MIELIIILAILSGLLQIWGYIIYIKDENIDPNPVTWFMFAYGTAILAVLEWDMSATWPELVLPVVCAVFSIYVSYKCWRKARAINPKKWWPEDWWPDDVWERYSFISDIFITVAYIIAWALASFALLASDYKELAVLAFLLLSNLSTIPAFYPLLHETHLHPHKENWLPWFVWTLAYVALALVTLLTHGTFWHILMLYPASNIVMHALVAWFARPTRQKDRLTTKSL